MDRQALADERRQPRRVRERVVEQQPPALVRDGGTERAHERVQPGAGPIAGERLLGGHREDPGLGRDRRQVVAREAERLGQLGVVEQVGLRDHEDQPIARRAQDALLQELALRRGQDLRRVEQKHRRVRARQVSVGDVGPLLVDVVDARRVDDRQPVGQQRRRVGDLDVVDGAGGLLVHLGRLRRLRARALLVSLGQPFDGDVIRQRRQVDREALGGSPSAAVAGGRACMTWASSVPSSA